jgi:hypothetical protein
VTKKHKVLKISQMRNKNKLENKPSKIFFFTKIHRSRLVRDSARDSGELMENSGDSARDSGGLRGGVKNSGDSDHPFWRTQVGTQGAPPLRPRTHTFVLFVSLALASSLLNNEEEEGKPSCGQQNSLDMDLAAALITPHAASDDFRARMTSGEKSLGILVP